MSTSLKPTILVIDDDPCFHDVVRYMLSDENYNVICVTGPEHLAQTPISQSPSVIFLDWHLARHDGTALIQPLRQDFPLCPIVFATVDSSPEIAASSIKLGAFDFLTKPLDESRLLIATAKAVEQHQILARLHRFEEISERGFQGIIGTSPQMQTVYSTIRNVAATQVNVMISGESGTGKELAATAIHTLSDRSDGPFVALNMASIPDDLVEATLFGHDKGAFTGADKQRTGAVRQAAGGTLFLDEITEMPMSLQGKLLRFLQEHVFRPVGSDNEFTADTRIVSATNRDPALAVTQQQLRADIYYRLNVVPVQMPTLRSRNGDVPLLCEFAIRKFSEKYGKRFTEVSNSALDVLVRYSWPGNVRQLMHVIERAIVLNHGDVIEPFMLPREIMVGSTSTQNSSWESIGAASYSDPMVVSSNVPPKATFDDRSRPLDSVPNMPPADAPSLSGRTLEEIERQAILDTLTETQGNKAEAARRLGISEKGIHNKIKRLGISQPSK